MMGLSIVILRMVRVFDFRVGWMECEGKGRRGEEIEIRDRKFSG